MKLNAKIMAFANDCRKMVISSFYYLLCWDSILALNYPRVCILTLAIKEAQESKFRFKNDGSITETLFLNSGEV